MQWLFFIVLIDGIGFGIILPLLPVFAIKFHMSAFHLGILTAAFSFFQLLMSPILGALSDRFGRKLIIILCLFLISLSYLILAYSHTFIHALLARILAGMFTGNVSVVLASAADFSNEENRTKYMGIIGAASGLGFMLGPIIGGVLSGNDVQNANFTLVFLVAAIFTCCAGFLAIFFLKETLNLKEAKESYSGIHLIKRFSDTISNILDNKGIVYLIVLSILMWFAFSAIYVFLTTWSVIRFNLSPMHLGIIATTFAFFTAIIQMLSSYIVEGGKAILIGFQLAGFSIFALLFNLDIHGVIIVCIFLATGLGLLFPNVNSAITFQSSKNDRGFILGLSQSAGMIGQTLGPLIVGYIYTLSSSYAWVTIGAAFFSASVITLKFMLVDKEEIAN